MKSALIVVFFWAAHFLNAQPIDVQFKNSTKISTQLNGTTQTLLLTIRGPVAFKEIASVSFWEAIPDSSTIVNLRSHGIAVYLKKQRLAPIKDQIAESECKSDFSLGLGLGLDFGGIGVRTTALPRGPVSLFAGLGYFGYNVGTELKFSPKKRSSGFLSAMYGYNGVVDNGIYGRQVFYGFSFGLGVKIRAAKSDKNYFSLQTIYPIRGSDFKQAAGTSFVFPILISIGFHFGF